MYSTINIVMTSYPRRIANCTKVIQSVLENTIQPDRIYLTLSHDEFPNWERDLPIDLYRLIMTSDRVILNWVEENDKSFKKVFPVLPYLQDDDIVIDIDDDMLLPRDFIESRLNDFENYGSNSPITSSLSKTINMDNLVVTCYSLFQKKMLAGYEKFVDGVVKSTFNDDRTYLYLCHMNGYMLVPCTKYCVGKSNGRVVPLQTMPHGDYKYETGGVYDGIVAPVVAKLSNGRRIGECFGLFKERLNPLDRKIEKDAAKLSLNQDSDEPTTPDISPNIAKLFQYNLKKPVKHDLVYVLGKGSKYKNLEVKISITSMLKFCDSWIGDIYVVGENPCIHNPRVKYLYAPDITKVNKDANIIHKLLTAIQKIPELSTNFLFCSDDILVTKKSDWEDFAPRYVFEYPQDDKVREKLASETTTPWDKLLLKTLDKFVGLREHIYFYEPHIFAPINKKYFQQMCKQIDYTKDRNVIIMSLWFNWLNLDSPQKRKDHQSAFSAKELPQNLKAKRHLTYNDAAFEVQKFRDDLIELVTMDEFK